MTLLNRRRYLDGISSHDNAERMRAERQAFSSVCQGSAADVVKLAMVQLHADLGKEEYLGRARLVLQVRGEGVQGWATRLVLQVRGGGSMLQVRGWGELLPMCY